MRSSRPPDAELRCLPMTIRTAALKYFRLRTGLCAGRACNYPSITSPASLPTLSISISTLCPVSAISAGERDGDARQMVAIMSPGISVMKVDDQIATEKTRRWYSCPDANRRSPRSECHVCRVVLRRQWLSRVLRS